MLVTYKVISLCVVIRSFYIRVFRGGYIVMKITSGIARVGRINRMENEFIFVFYTENRAKCDLNGRFV